MQHCTHLMDTGFQCNEPIIKNEKLGVWAHMDVSISDHWAVPVGNCRCRAEYANDHFSQCPARLDSVYNMIYG